MQDVESPYPDHISDTAIPDPIGQTMSDGF